MSRVVLTAATMDPEECFQYFAASLGVLSQEELLEMEVSECSLCNGSALGHGHPVNSRDSDLPSWSLKACGEGKH